MERFAALALIVAAGCGGEVGDVLDAAPDDGGGIDAARIDAAIDAPTDAAPPPPFSGTFSIVESERIQAGVTASFGQGLQVTMAFHDGSMLPAPVMEEQAGPLGCKAWQYTPAQAAHASLGQGEGAVTLTFTGGTSPATPPAMPPCSFAAGAGYRCTDFTTGSGGGVIAAGAADTATFTDVDVTYTAANALGRYLRITGATMDVNNGVFPITGVTAPSTVTYVNAARVAELLPGSANHINVAGAGAIPGVIDPGFLADDAALTFTHVAGGGNHVPAFTLMTTGPGHLGDDFTLDPATVALITHLPTTGAELPFVCATGCSPDSAPESVVEIITTDAPVAGLAPSVMPAPIGKQVRIRCAAAATGTITVPAAYSARLTSAGATRIQATFTRGVTLAWPEPPVTGLVGHAITAFTTL